MENKITIGTLENFDLPDGMFYAKVFIGEQVVVTKVVKK